MSTTELIDFIESNEFDINIYSIKSNLVSSIRKYIREIYSRLYELDSYVEATGILRLQLLKLHSSPDMISTSFLSDCSLSDSHLNERILGREVAVACDNLDKIIKLYNKSGSPLATKLTEVVSKNIELYSLGKVKIWCHKREQGIYQDLFLKCGINLTDNNFISSLAEYRNVEFFEVLIRVGPLRSHGWSKLPQVIISSPKFVQLLQFYWAGSFNEEGFGLDPVLNNINYLQKFKRHETVVENYVDFNESIDDEFNEVIDDFFFFNERPVHVKKGISCFLFEFPSDMGVMLTPGSHQLVFINGDVGIVTYKDADEIEPGYFLILHDIEIDLGDDVLNVGGGKLAVLWKTKLAELYKRSPALLRIKMREAGINLCDLDRAANKWVQYDGDIICGPQNKIHFQFLIDSVLTGVLGEHTWKHAWDEIENSRVQAIQNGRIEAAIVNEQLVSELNTDIFQIKQRCSSGEFFRREIKQSSDLSGMVRFYPVTSVSVGFKVPHEIIGDISPIILFESYRTDV
jgi:hypothetical protein